MEIKHYPSNSITKKEVKQVEMEKPIKPVTSAIRVKPKNSIIKKFIQEDLKDIGKYILNDVIIPKLKDTIAEAVRGSIDKAFYGEVRQPEKKSNTYVNYSKPTQTNVQRNKASHDFDDIAFGTRREAEEMLNELVRKCRKEGEVSVGDLYDLVGMHAEYTDRQYGWYNLSLASIKPCKEGYMMVLPKTVHLR